MMKALTKASISSSTILSLPRDDSVWVTLTPRPVTLTDARITPTTTIIGMKVRMALPPSSKALMNLPRLGRVSLYMKAVATSTIREYRNAVWTVHPLTARKYTNVSIGKPIVQPLFITCNGDGIFPNVAGAMFIFADIRCTCRNSMK